MGLKAGVDPEMINISSSFGVNRTQEEFKGVKTGSCNLNPDNETGKVFIS